ncbi:hypothetical protein [Treponema primitia]|uniref:hypothetical protein n=1 Tax=Treponema primitia TaxID=88058 RepID=UPI0002555660|nr:hypothetical protein [Treponema primitia]
MSLKYLKWAVPVLCGLLVFTGCPTDDVTNVYYTDDVGDLSVSVNGSYGVAHPGSESITNYILLNVRGGDYTKGAYTLDDAAITPTPVLIEGGRTTLVKIAVPAGSTTVALGVEVDKESILDEEVTFDAAGAAPPAVLYGEVPMQFSEFFHDITADITDIHPASTTFNKADRAAAPQLLITAGTRTGNDSTGTANKLPKWTDKDAFDKVDAISSATFGDGVHFPPTANLSTNYSPVTTKADWHEITGIKKVDVGVDFDLYANAVLLDAADRFVTTSTAVLEKVEAITWKAENNIYKAKYLRPDAAWGKREDTPKAAAAGWPTPASGTAPTPSVSYGGNWGDKVISYNFGENPKAPNGNTVISNDVFNLYFEKIYGGYVEDSTGHREPIVWLQQLFSHRPHTNLEVCIQRPGISRTDNLTPNGTIKVVVYADGLEDLTFNAAVGEYATSFTIEQGSVFYTTGTGVSATLQESDGTDVPNRQLHVTSLSAAAVEDFDTYGGVLRKGNAALAAGTYTAELEDNEIAITLKDTFFAGPFQGDYNFLISTANASAISATASRYKAVPFTVNRLAATRPQVLSIDAGVAATDANTVATAIVVTKGDKITFENNGVAHGFALTGASPSTILVNDTTTALTIATVLKRDTPADPYSIDTSSLTAGTLYRLHIVTANVFRADRAALPIADYYIKINP